MEFAVLFLDVPGKTGIIFHDVDTGNELSIKQHPYIVNVVKLMHMRNEVDYMVPTISVLILGKLIQSPRQILT